MSAHPLPKKPKIEVIEESEEEEPEEEEPEEEDPVEEEPEEEDPAEEEPEEENDYGNVEEQGKRDEVLILEALIEHRKKEAEHLRLRITYYKSQLDETEKKLEDAQNKLAQLQGHNFKKDSKNVLNGREEANVERRSSNPVKKIEGSSQKLSQSAPLHQLHDTTKPPASQNQTQSRPLLVIPSLNHPQLVKPKESWNKFSRSGSPSTSSKHLTDLEDEKACKRSSGQEIKDTQQHEGTKRKIGSTPLLVIDLEEHRDLIKLISKSSSLVPLHCHTACLLSSQHKRKLRSLVLCPTNDQLFVTSALDGVVNLWQLEGRGSSANLLSSTDCKSEQRRWPEDIAWHPLENKLFSVYSASDGDSQVSILNLNKGKQKACLRFLKDKPHIKGIINGITFMPWDKKSFVTGGSDHAVFLWSDENGEDLWKPKLLHRDCHSSSVMGVAGLHHKNIVMSAGADKRIVGFDALRGQPHYRHQIDSKCMSVVPNPCDFNLFMVQTGTHERQLRLFDVRVRQKEVHTFGWKQESSESHSALINQAWSQDGLYITSGSADPVFHIFDIRYNAHKPSYSVRAHCKRVFKAAWHHALPLLISISSDLNIGLHKIT